MAVGQNNSVSRSQVGEVVTAFNELIGRLTNGRTILRDRLIKTHSNSAATIPVEHHLGHMLGVSQVIDALSHIQRYQLPVDDGFVVFESRIHTKNHESSF